MHLDFYMIILLFILPSGILTHTYFNFGTDIRIFGFDLTTAVCFECSAGNAYWCEQESKRWEDDRSHSNLRVITLGIDHLRVIGLGCRQRVKSLT